MRPMTNENKVIEYLMSPLGRREGLTHRQAVIELNINQVGFVIFNLRKKGWTIELQRKESRMAAQRKRTSLFTVSYLTRTRHW